jgi:ligand-binding SRPBCC domain-containing protein
VPEAGFSESMRFGVPAEFAFAFLADPSTAPVIDPAVREYKPDSVPMCQGTRNLIRFRMWGLPVRVTSIVREWEPGRRMVMENVQPSWPVRAVATHSFAPDGEACTYTWAMEFRCSGPIGAVVGRVFARFMQSNARAQQVRFRQEVERRFQHEDHAGGGVGN